MLRRNAVRRTATHLSLAAVLVATIAGCGPGDPPLSETTGSTWTELTSEAIHLGDVPCRNRRADERGAAFPADDVYVDGRTIEWPRAPGEAGFDDTALESAIQDVGLSSTVLSLLIVRDGRLVAEEYFNGAEASHAHNVFSMTKLLTALAVGSAVEDGLVPSLTTPLSEWVEETAGGPAADVTLEQLLSMRSGLDTDPVEPFAADVVGAAPLAAEPGAGWEYVTNNSELLALGLDRRTPSGLCEYVHNRVLEPIGVTVDHWHETPYGSVTGGSYAFMTPRELARLGQLLLDNGKWAGQQVVPAAWIAAMTGERTDFGCQRGVAARANRLIRSGYGMHVGLAEVAGHQVWETGGYGGQAILVVPDLGLVVVITQEVGPVFERRLSVLDALEFAILPALTLVETPKSEPCPVSQLVQIDDGTETTLAVGACCLSDWSPDGLQIAFSQSVDLNSELYVIGADGRGLRRLTAHGASDVLPRWSPDGARIAFASDRGTSLRMPIPELDLWILDVPSSDTRALTQGLGDVLGHSWSPDGEKIVFSRADVGDRPGGDLWVIEVDTGDVELLARGDFAWPEWSPDGDTIAAVTHRDGDPFIVLLDARTRHAVNVTNGDLPRWTPDSHSLLVTRANSIVKVDTLDGFEDIITDGCCASVAPDGLRIVVSVES